MFGLSVDTLRNLRAAFAQDMHIEKVLIYGSRTKGNYKTGSDIDITLIGKGLTLTDTIYPLRDRLRKLYLPYKFDISIFNQLDEDEFIEHILWVGETLYQRETGVGEEWESVLLGDICEFRHGLIYKKSDEVSHSKNAVLRANNISLETGEINFDEIRFISNEIKYPNQKWLRPVAC